MKFTKMQGTGNDFIVVDQIDEQFNLSKSLIRKLSDRYFGIGFDQLLIIEKSDFHDADFKYRIFNSDGGEVEQCGNGARCFYKYIKYYGLSANSTIKVETLSGITSLSQDNEGLVKVDMGLPDIRTTINRHGVNYDHVLIGNPHAVINLADNNISEKDYQDVANDIQSTWKDGINVGFMSIIDKNSIKLRVFERGSGFTMACGSGACAASAVAISKNKLEMPITVNMDGGVVQIDWDMKNTMTLSGSAEISFEGEVNLNAYA
ncbi:diaminopimelate epimerase [Methylophilales bacterium]|nr:diaminopimelate epimerase [Methylophilales bacterium]